MKDRGFSLLETLVALSIFALATGAVMPALVSQLKFNTDSEIKTGAIAASAVVMDELRTQKPNTLPLSGAAATKTVFAGERNYDVDVEYCANGTYCSANMRHIVVRVSYQGEQFYEVETVYTNLR